MSQNWCDLPAHVYWVIGASLGPQCLRSARLTCTSWRCAFASSVKQVSLRVDSGGEAHAQALRAAFPAFEVAALQVTLARSYPPDALARALLAAGACTSLRALRLSVGQLLGDHQDHDARLGSVNALWRALEPGVARLASLRPLQSLLLDAAALPDPRVMAPTMASLRQLTQLRVAGASMRVMPAHVALLGQLPALKALTLRVEWFVREESEFMELPRALSGLTHLELAQASVVSHAVLELPERMPSLALLSIAGVHMDDWQVLSSCSDSLSALHVCSPCRVNSAAWAHIRCLPRLQHFTVHEPTLQRSDWQALPHVLCRLRCLSLGLLDIAADTALLAQLPALTALCLTERSSGDARHNVLTQLTPLTGLRSFSATCLRTTVKLTGQVVKTLAAAWQLLESFSFSGLLWMSAAEMAGFRAFPALTALHLRCPSLSADDVNFSADLADLPPTLTSFQAGWGHIGSTAKRVRLARLERLALHCCQVQHEYEGLSRLRCLHLSNCSALGDTEFGALCTALPRLTSLRVSQRRPHCWKVRKGMRTLPALADLAELELPLNEAHLLPEELMETLLRVPRLRRLRVTLQSFECDCPRKRSFKRLGSSLKRLESIGKRTSRLVEVANMLEKQLGQGNRCQVTVEGSG